VHPLAALSHTTGDVRTEGIVLAQRQGEQKTSGIARFAPCWTRSTSPTPWSPPMRYARYLVERGGHYVFTATETSTASIACSTHFHGTKSRPGPGK
jgi:hypothetical protein